jgi:L-iditol 2-dehydrogenase
MCRVFKESNLDPGGFAELVRVPAPNVAHATFSIPDHVSDEVASFTEPLACCLRAVRRCRIEAGDVGLVVGLGSIGCLLAQALALAGAHVLGVDLMPERRAVARALGIDVGDGTGAIDVALAEATRGRGADVVVLTAGGAAALPWAAARARDGGALHYFAGGVGDALPLPLEVLYHRELTLTATYSSAPADLAEAFALLTSGRVRVDGLITHRLPLAELSRAVDLMRSQRAVKVYVTP